MFFKYFKFPPLLSASQISESARVGMNERLSKRYPHPGSQSRKYNVYVPAGYRSTKPLPLVMVLHGCHQTHHDIQLISDFNTLADKHNFIVIYPFVTYYRDMRSFNCWGWWRPEHIKPGMGEVEDLRCILLEVTQEFSIDRRRVHIAGLSAGGGMAVAALVAHPGLFASGAVCAGVAYGESAAAVSSTFSKGSSLRPVNRILTLMERARQKDRTPVPLFIVHSHDDKTVTIQASKNLRDSWLRYFGYHNKPIKSVSFKHIKGIPCMHTRYGKFFSKSFVETVFIQGPGHGWYGGHAGEFSYPEGPDISRLMWDFFKRHQLTSTKLD